MVSADSAAQRLRQKVSCVVTLYSTQLKLIALLIIN